LLLLDPVSTILRRASGVESLGEKRKGIHLDWELRAAEMIRPECPLVDVWEVYREKKAK